MNDQFGPEDSGKLFASRFRIMYIGVGIWFIIYVMRLWQLQILNGAELRLFSEKNLLKESRIIAPRGIISDRDGQILVENLPGFVVTISPQYTSDVKSVAEAMSPIVGIKPEKIIGMVKKSRRANGPFYPARIKENLSRDEVFQLKQLRLDHSGLDIQEIIVRSYPLNEIGANLFGYVSEISNRELPKRNKSSSFIYKQGDLVGKSGIESAYEKNLRGVSGLSFKQVDARGRLTSKQSLTILGQRVKGVPATPGNNLVLTIDKDLQIAAFKAFEKKDRVGALIAVRPTGEVLAWVNRPTFNPNDFSTGITSEIWKKLLNDPNKPLRNKVIQDHHSPGSTFKAFVALAGLQEKLINPTQKLNAPGVFKYGRGTYHDHQRGGHGKINLYEALERSSNVYFYRLGVDLGIDKMHRYISSLGIGKKTGIELGREVPGLMPSAEWKLRHKGEQWLPGENVINAIGQGYVLTTPIQMAMAYSAIATEGKLYRPYLVKKVVSHDGLVVQEQEPILLRDLTEPDEDGLFISKENFKHVKQGLWKVANGSRGSARYWKIPGVEFSGKTGTTQVRRFSADNLFLKCDDRPHNQRHHGWFVGYAPKDNPQITVAVLAEHACGGTRAAPIVKDVIEAYFRKYHPEIIAKGEEEQKKRWRRAAKRKRELEKKKKEQEESNAGASNTEQETSN